MHDQPHCIDFGPADFGPTWQNAQLLRGPPTSASELEALRQEIALLETAIRLCDTLPCRDDNHIPSLEGAQHAEQHSPLAMPTTSLMDSKQGRKYTSRKLSELASQQEQQGGENDRVTLLVVPAVHAEHSRDLQECSRGENLSIDQPVRQNTAAAAASVGVAAPLAASSSDIVEEIEEPEPGLPSVRSFKRRKVERELAAAEAAAERAFRVQPTSASTTLDGRIDQQGELRCNGPRPFKMSVGVGTAVKIKWDDGCYIGQVVEINASKGQHKVAYADGDLEWHDLDSEEWCIVVYGEENCSEEVKISQQAEPMDIEAADEIEEKSAPKSGSRQGICVVPDSQIGRPGTQERKDREEQTARASEAPPALTVTVDADKNDMQQAPEEMNGIIPNSFPESIPNTENAAAILSAMCSGGGAGFILASQLPLGDDDPQPPPEAQQKTK